MKQLVLLFSLCTVMAFQANAQRRGSATDYVNAVGVRVNPWLVGATFQHFFTENHAFETIASTNVSRRTNVTFTALYEYHFDLGDTPLRMYAGGGVHVGVYDRWDYDRDRYWKHGDGSYATPGVDGIIGLEYKFKKIPLVISGDLKPYVNFVGGTHHIGEEIGGASARYTF